MSWSKNIKEELLDKRNIGYDAGGRERINKVHSEGKMTARERLEMLFDDGAFQEICLMAKSDLDLDNLNKKHYYGDGVICGFGQVNGYQVFAVSQDCTISGGSGGEKHVDKICRTLEMAINNKKPIVFLCDSGGARIDEGILSLSAYSRLFRLNEQASGYILQLAAIMGNCAGGSSYSPVMCDFVFMVKDTSQLFITGPKVIETLTGEKITMNELGGYDVHDCYSGQVHRVCASDMECIEEIKTLLSYFLNRHEESGGDKDIKDLPSLEEIVPERKRESYDVKKVINNIVDKDSFFEFQKRFAPNIVIGLARLSGKTIGVVANQPNYLGGSIDIDAADKAARFIRTCDCYDIPILTLVDVPGFYPGKESEMKGIIRHGCKLLYAYSEASVPKVTLILRKAYGGAYCAMNSKNIGADFVFAWPICEIAVMGADSAIDVMYKKKLDVNNDYKRDNLIKEYEEKYLNPYFAAEKGLIDEVIMPEESRTRIISTFNALESKKEIKIRKKHGNISM